MQNTSLDSPPAIRTVRKPLRRAREIAEPTTSWPIGRWEVSHRREGQGGASPTNLIQAAFYGILAIEDSDLQKLQNLGALSANEGYTSQWLDTAIIDNRGVDDHKI